MKFCSFRGLFLLFCLCFWVNENGQYLTAEYMDIEIDIRFMNYKKCLKNYSVSSWKLLGPKHNASYYGVFNFRFNKLFDKAFPIAIITPTSSDDVSFAVKCGVETDIQLVPVSGGHSYAGLSFGTNNSIIIDFCYMRHISIDHNEMVATVEPGTFLGHLYGTLWKNGRLGAPLGVCATVAMGGFVLGGGIGYFSSLYGLVIDNLVEINMVDASGNAIRVNETHHVDLWWAMRGVGPGYIGLVTSVKLRVFKADELKLTFVQIRYHNRSFKHVMESFVEWLNWVKENDPSINSVISILSDEYENPDKPGWPGIELQLLQVQDPNIKTTTGNPAFLNVSRRIFPEPVEFIVTFPSFIDFVVAYGYAPVVMTRTIPDTIESKLEFLASLSKDRGIPRYFYAKSFFVKKPYHAANLREAEKVLLNVPNDSCGIYINSEQGAIAERRPDESSYFHRDALFNFKVFLEAVDAQHVGPCRKWMKIFLKAVKFLDSGKTYQNYPERELTNYLDRYYGTNLERLIEIKKKWDPNHYFNSRMSLPIN